MYELNPNIDKKLDKYTYKSPKLWKFDEELERVKWGWGKKSLESGTLDQQIAVYASEFKERAARSENL